MHDWTLVFISIFWNDSIVRIGFKDQNYKEKELIAVDFKNLIVPKKDDWGRSVSVNEIIGPVQIQNDLLKLCIETQSGDMIEIEAKKIVMPDNF